MPHPDESIAHILTREGYIEGVAAYCAEMALERTYRRNGWGPKVFDDAAVIRRADKDIEIDLRMDAGYGFETTQEQRDEYRRRYRAGFLAAWRDEAVFEKIRAMPRAGFIIVCMR